MTLINNLSSV